MLTGSKWEMIETIRKDIRAVKAEKGAENVIVLWTANTERFSEIIKGVNDTAENLLNAIKSNHPEVSPSTLFAVASILEGVTIIIVVIMTNRLKVNCFNEYQI